MLALLTYAQAYLNQFTSKFEAEDGQGMIEYALIIGVISLVVIFAFITLDLQNSITALTSKVSSAIDAAPSGPVGGGGE